MRANFRVKNRRRTNLAGNGPADPPQRRRILRSLIGAHIRALDPHRVHAGAVRRREAAREYVGGALWVLPFVVGNAALVIGFALAQVDVVPGSFLWNVAFRGSSADARTLLLTITGTVVTVIALVLGLSIVALQLSSTQFSPRLLRNFLRDRPNQVVLSVFMATFAYSAAGLLTVGVGAEPEKFPRLAVTGALALLFASIAAVAYFADHLSHSIQVDAIMRRVERETLEVIARLPRDVELVPPTAPPWAVPIAAKTSGYVVTAHPEQLLPLAATHGVSIALSRRVGEHVVPGTVLAQIWTSRPDDELPDPHVFEHALDDAVGIGFERTRQQDVAIGIRQLVDVACKALSPAVNDPYTAIQAVDHMAVIFAAMAVRPLGPRVGRAGDCAVVIPSRRFGEYLGTMCGLVRRYGSAEPTVSLALLRLLDTCASIARTDRERLQAVADQARLIAADAERETRQAVDVEPVRSAQSALLRRIEAFRALAE